MAEDNFELLSDAVRRALENRRVTGASLRQALAICEVAPSAVSMAMAVVLDVDGFSRAVTDGRDGRSAVAVLPDVSVEARYLDPSLSTEDVAAALRVWTHALGREGRPVTIGHAYAVPLERSREAHEAVRGAPILVSHPLTQMIAGLEARNAHAAYLNLKDSAEGVVRLMWLLLIRETMQAALAEEDLRSLDPGARQALRDLMARVAGRSFSLGDAVRLLVGTRADGGDSVISRLCAGPWSETLHFSCELESEVAQPGVRKGLLNLADWRNKDVGHGIIGGERRLHRLLRHDDPGEPDPVQDLAHVLIGLAPWLEGVGGWARGLGWPQELDPRPEHASTGAPEPIAWVGGGAPLWVLDGMERDSLRVLDVLSGGRSRRQRWKGTNELADMLARAAEDSLPLDEDMQGRDRRDAAARATWESRRWSTPLRDRIAEATDTHRFVHVVGGGGTGKSFLLREVERRLTDQGGTQQNTIVVAFRGHAGIATSSAILLSSIYAALKGQAGVRAPREPSDALMIPEVATAGIWWRALAEGNPSTRFILLVDTLEEMVAKENTALDVLPWGLSRHRIVLATRPRAELAAPFVAALDKAASQGCFEVDLDVHYAGNEGAAEVAAYLREHHKQVAARHHDILNGARRGTAINFLHTFHLARGFEVGFQPARVDGVAGWSYGDYLGWLEGRVHGHAGYVRCLRSVLLTLAEVLVPVNERTLRRLLGAPPRGSADGGPGFIDWLPWVLRDLEDFISRRRPPTNPSAPSDIWASQVTWFDARVRPVDASVLEPAHAELRAYLSSEELPDAWGSVRDDLRTTRHDVLMEVLAEPSLPTTSEARYFYGIEAPRAMAASGHTDGGALGSQAVVDAERLNAWLRHVPVSFIGTGCPGFWVTSIRRVLELGLPRSTVPDLNVALGRALSADHRPSEALDAFRTAVAGARAEMGMGSKVDERPVGEFVSGAPAVAATLATALEAIGQHFAERNRREGAQEADQALVLRRVLHENAPDDRDAALAYADALALAAFARTRTQGVGRLIIAGGGQPPQLGQVGRAAGIYGAYLGVGQPLSEEGMRDAAARDPQTVLGLMRVLGLGIEVACAYEDSSLDDLAHDLRICLASLPPPSGDRRVARYASFRTIIRALESAANGLHRFGRIGDAVALYKTLLPETDSIPVDATEARDLASVLLGFNERHLGLARAYRDDASIDACERTVRWAVHVLLALAELPWSPDAEQIGSAIRRGPDAMKTLVVGLLQVTEIFRPIGRRAIAVDAMALLVQVMRSWTGLEASATTDQQRAVARALPWAHQAMAQALEQSARYRLACGDRTGAREALRECEALVLSGGGFTFPGMLELPEP